MLEAKMLSKQRRVSLGVPSKIRATRQLCEMHAFEMSGKHVSLTNNVQPFTWLSVNYALVEAVRILPPAPEEHKTENIEENLGENE